MESLCIPENSRSSLWQPPLGAMVIELDLIGQLDDAPSRPVAEVKREPVVEVKREVSSPEPEPRRTYSCTYCPRKFYSGKALEGHQNKHKRERAIARRDGSRSNSGGGNSSGVGSGTNQQCRVVNRSVVPSMAVSWGSYGTRPMDVQANSMVDRPYVRASAHSTMFDRQQATGGYMSLTKENYRGGAANVFRGCRWIDHGSRELQKVDLTLKL